MKIILNNREEEFTGEKMTITRMLELKKFTFRMRIIRVNGKLIPRDEYDSTMVNDGDNIEMIYLMSGG
jgi:sulfur carrier protein